MYKDGQSMKLHEVKSIIGDPVAILDVGAHTGQFYSWAKDVWPTSVIWMVEANEVHEPALQDVTKDSNDNYVIATLGDTERDVKFYTRSDKPQTEGASYYKESNYWDIPHLVKEIPKTLQTIDDLFDTDSEFQLVKLDTQGSELDILRGGVNLCKKAKAIILEVSYVEYNEGAPLAEEIINFMKEYGYNNHIEIGEHFSSEPQWKDIVVQKDLCFYK